MITESYYYKNYLIRASKILRGYKLIKRWNPVRCGHVVEREIFLSMYLIRKMIESQKVTDQVAGMKIKTKCFPVKNDCIVTRHSSFDKKYNLEAVSTKYLDLSYTCNQIIHSYVFEIVLSEKKIPFYVVICSDRKRNAELYMLKINQVISMIEAIAKDNIVKSISRYDESKKDFIVKNY